MLGQIQDLVLPNALPVTVSLEPVLNGLHSLWLLIEAEAKTGLDDWVTDTAAALTPEERETLRLILVGFYCAILPDQSLASFPAYLDHLATSDPFALRDRLLERYTEFLLSSGRVHRYGSDPSPIDWHAVLASVDAYLDFLGEHFGTGYIDIDLEARAYSYIIDPPAMLDLSVSHLRNVWERFLAPEWERVAPVLRDAVEAFGQVDLAHVGRLEAARQITGHTLEKETWYDEFERAEHVVFVPTTHVGPYLGKFWGGETVWIFFGARLPAGVQFYAPDLSRAEIVVRLRALTDDGRLRILRLISERGELCSQEIMQSLGMSQSTASRHLKQLSATGYLVERRHNSAKCYALDPGRIKDTLQAISAFLLDS